MSLFYSFFTPTNKEVWVGKNSRANDIITFEKSYCKDLWFHNGISSGSHVILRYDINNSFTQEDILFAAQLAIKYSSNTKSKEVHYTFCIDIEKPKKSSHGQVHLLSYKTLFL